MHMPVRDIENVALYETHARWKMVRWWILALLFCATVINYVDRQSLSLLIATLQRVFAMDTVRYGQVVASFLVAYTAAYMLAGPLCDALGVRRSMVLFIAWWSCAELIPPLTHSLKMLTASRFLLGIGEAGVWVVAPKAVGEIFPADKRALAIGIYTAGASIGAVIAPPFVSGMTLHYGWQSVFFTTGCAGLLWILPWWLFYRDQRSEQAIQRTRLFDSSAILSACRESNLWLLLVARMITDPLWYFFLFWYPKYLEDARYLSLSQLGKIGWIVYLAADIGAVAGGWASGQLIRRSMQTLKARRTVALCAALVIPCTPLIALTQSLYGSIAFASAVALAHMIWLITLGALVVDLFPQRYVATAFGLTATGSGLGGLISTELISHSIAHSGYFTAFCVMGMLHPIALVPIFLLRDRGRRDESSAGIPAVEGL